MKKKVKTEFPVTPFVSSLFEQAVEMQMNADIYLRRHRQLTDRAWEEFRKDTPDANHDEQWQYHHDSRMVRLIEEKKK